MRGDLVYGDSLSKTGKVSLDWSLSESAGLAAVEAKDCSPGGSNSAGRPATVGVGVQR